MTKKFFPILIATVLLFPPLFAGEITFSGGYTRVSLQEGNRSVELSDGARASSDSIEIEADKILLYGPDYRFTDCTGNIRAREKEHSLEIRTTSLFYDREEEKLLSNGWIEIDDTENEVKISCSWFEYDINARIMVLQMKATMEKVTERGILKCSADSIEYNADLQTLSLRGNADVTWGSDNYRASYITLDIETEEVVLQGSITGEING